MKKNIAYLLLCVFFVSCSLIDVASEDTVEIHTTVGQELIDLDRALKEGAITQIEYDKAKAKILDRE